MCCGTFECSFQKWVVRCYPVAAAAYYQEITMHNFFWDALYKYNKYSKQMKIQSGARHLFSQGSNKCCQLQKSYLQLWSRHMYTTNTSYWPRNHTTTKTKGEDKKWSLCKPVLKGTCPGVIFWLGSTDFPNIQSIHNTGENGGVHGGIHSIVRCVLLSSNACGQEQLSVMQELQLNLIM